MLTANLWLSTEHNNFKRKTLESNRRFHSNTGRSWELAIFTVYLLSSEAVILALFPKQVLSKG